MATKTTQYDVIVVGGGASGMMAAGRAGALGKKVLLLEKNPLLGQKLKISGGGRCNITNAEEDIHELLKHYKKAAPFLYSPFSQFSNKDTFTFFESLGLPLVVQARKRAFPKTEKAFDVFRALEKYMKQGGVTVLTETKVSRILKEGDVITGIIAGGVTYTATSYIVATGGLSHPETGSTGDGFKWLRSLGHTIVENSFALVPIAIKDTWVKRLAGVSLQDIKMSVLLDNKRKDSRRGKLLFTHFGISGPTVLNMSSKIGDLLQAGPVVIEIDLLPEMDHGVVNTEILKLFINESNRMIKNTLGKIIPSSMVQIVLELAGVDPDKENNSVTREERVKVIKIVKGIPLRVKRLMGADKAIVSSGGVKMEEVDFKTMRSRLVPNLYLVGDVLDIHRPSGGYSLQLCWATGYVAGESC